MNTKKYNKLQVAYIKAIMRHHHITEEEATKLYIGTDAAGRFATIFRKQILKHRKEQEIETKIQHIKDHSAVKLQATTTSEGINILIYKKYHNGKLIEQSIFPAKQNNEK